MKRKLLISVISAVLSLILGELVVRWTKLAPALRLVEFANDDSPYIRSSNPILAYEMRPNLRGTGESMFVPKYTNRFGQRDVERSIERHPGVRRVILLGDSVVANLDVWETDEQMSRQLERLYPDGTVEVLNFGVGGYCTLAEVELLRTKGLQFQPDLVIVLFVEDDFDNFNSEVGVMMHHPRQSRLRTVALRTSHLARLVAGAASRWRLSAQSESLASHPRAIGNDNVSQGLALLGQLSSEHGFDVLVAIWPTFEDQGIRDGRFMPGGQELIVEVLASKHSIPSVRLSSYFRGDWKARGLVNPRVSYTVGDFMHPNELGARVAALALKAALDGAVPPAAASTPLQYQRASRMAQGESSTPPDFVSALLHGGQVISAFGDQVRALAHYEAAAELSPESAAPQLAAGQLMYQLGRYDEAAHYFDRALAVNSSSPGAHFFRGLVARALGDAPGAIEHLKKAISLPRDATQALLYPWVQQSHVEYARVLVAQGDSAGAADHLEQTLAESPWLPLVRFELARLMQAQGRWSKATEHYTRALDGHPKPELVHNNLAVVLERLGRSSKAEEHYRHAIELNPDYAAAWNNLGVIVFTRGDLATAEVCCRRALRIDPSLKKAEENLAAILSLRNVDASASRSKVPTEPLPDGSPDEHERIDTAP